ncbi:MAG: WD40 repeat domain-containing protein [Rickettsiales bacterium]|jgi:hypothetical protein|nr:WD40 repeat domain-containing protein [Rickettsiales bacterium]
MTNKKTKTTVKKSRLRLFLGAAVTALIGLYFPIFRYSNDSPMALIYRNDAKTLDVLNIRNMKIKNILVTDSDIWLYRTQSNKSNPFDMLIDTGNQLIRINVKNGDKKVLAHLPDAKDGDRIALMKNGNIARAEMYFSDERMRDYQNPRFRTMFPTEQEWAELRAAKGTFVTNFGTPVVCVVSESDDGKNWREITRYASTSEACDTVGCNRMDMAVELDGDFYNQKHYLRKNIEKYEYCYNGDGKKCRTFDGVDYGVFQYGFFVMRSNDRYAFVFNGTEGDSDMFVVNKKTGAVHQLKADWRYGGISFDAHGDFLFWADKQNNKLEIWDMKDWKQIKTVENVQNFVIIGGR